MLLWLLCIDLVCRIFCIFLLNCGIYKKIKWVYFQWNIYLPLFIVVQNVSNSTIFHKGLIFLPFYWIYTALVIRIIHVPKINRIIFEKFYSYIHAYIWCNIFLFFNYFRYLLVTSPFLISIRAFYPFLLWRKATRSQILLEIPFFWINLFQLKWFYI